MRIQFIGFYTIEEMEEIIQTIRLDDNGSQRK